VGVLEKGRWAGAGSHCGRLRVAIAGGDRGLKDLLRRRMTLFMRKISAT
jgi:hypothetical protein